MLETDAIPVSASIASTGLGIRYIGNYCYAYNTAGASTTSADVFKFTTNSGVVVGEIELNPQVEYANGSTGAARIRISFNGNLIGILITEATDFYRSAMKLVIPPTTEVQVEVVSAEDTAAEIITVSFTGRVYGAV